MYQPTKGLLHVVRMVPQEQTQTSKGHEHFAVTKGSQAYADLLFFMFLQVGCEIKGIINPSFIVFKMNLFTPRASQNISRFLSLAFTKSDYYSELK